MMLVYASTDGWYATVTKGLTNKILVWQMAMTHIHITKINASFRNKLFVSQHSTTF